MKPITYKYWIFILKNEYIDLVPGGIVLGPSNIYAYTDNKEKAKAFKQFRNMNLFIEKRVNLTKDEVHDLTATSRNLYLVCQRLKTKKGDRCIEVDASITMNEQKVLDLQEMSIVSKILYNPHIIYPGIFTEDVQKALNILKYNAIFIKQQEGLGTDDLKDIHCELDELQVFINLFYTLLRRDDNDE